MVIENKDSDEDKEEAEALLDCTALDWLRRERADGFVQRERDAFELWRSDPDNARALQRVQKLDAALNQISDRPAIAALRQRVRDNNTQKHEKNDTHKNKTVFYLKELYGRSAALRKTKVVAGAVSIAAFAACFLLLLPLWQGVHTSGVGEVKSLVLQDASTAVLDTDSRIRVAYSNSERRVYLQRGQVYFKVAKNTEKPFVVYTDTGKITAVGTAFIVRENDSKLSVILQEGKVDVIDRTKKETDSVLRLNPGEQWQLTKSGVGTKSLVSDMETLTSWVGGTLVFHSKRLEHVLAEVNRYSDVKIKLKDVELARKKVDAVYQIGKTQSFVAALCEMLGLEYEYDLQDNIRIISKNTYRR